MENQRKQFCYVEIDIALADEIVEPNPDPQVLDAAAWYQDLQFWIDSAKLAKINGKTYLKGEMLTFDDQNNDAKWSLDCNNAVNIWTRWGWDRKDLLRIHDKKGRRFSIKRARIPVSVHRKVVTIHDNVKVTPKKDSDNQTYYDLEFDGAFGEVFGEPTKDVLHAFKSGILGERERIWDESEEMVGDKVMRKLLRME